MILSGKATGGRLRAATFFSALAALCAGQANAGSFQVNPVNIVVRADARAASVTIRNTGDKPASIRVLTYRWTQADGRDVYTPANDLIASPPIFTSAPGATQLVRVGLRSRSPDQEQAYRIVFEEIPSVSTAGESGIQVAVRLDLPFYKLPRKRGAPAILWSSTRSPDGEVVLTAVNSGTLHQQVTGISAVADTPAGPLLTGGMGVVLPGSARQWKMGRHPGLLAGTRLNLVVRNPSGETRSTVTLDPR